MNFDQITHIIGDRKLSSIPQYFGITVGGIDKTVQPLVREVVESYFELVFPKSMFLCGGVGCGKTATMEIVRSYLGYGSWHYCQGQADYEIAKMRQIKRVTHFEMVQQLREKADNPKGKFDIDAFALFLDDLGTAHETDWNLSLLQQFFNSRWELRKPTYITSNKSPEELREWPGWSRIVDRILDPEHTIKYNYGDNVKSRRRDERT